jgi:Fe-S cluster assembly protein SufD
MAQRTVVSRTRRSERLKGDVFNFNRNMIPTAEDGSVLEYRASAWDLFEKFPMPTTRDEPWRRTDLRGFKAVNFHLVNQLGNEVSIVEPPAELLAPLADAGHGGQIVMTPSGLNSKLDPDLLSKGVVFVDLLTAERDYRDLLESIRGRLVKPEEGKFSALTAALAQQGVLLYVPPGVQLEQPLHSVIWGAGVGLAQFSHLLIWVDEGASLTYVHEAASHTEVDGQAMHAGIVEIHVREGASLRFVELQSWGEHVWNFSHERARVERDGNLDWIFGAIGSHLTKNFSDMDLAGQGANGRMSGFYFTDGVQHLDHDTQQNHLAPNTTSDLLFKGALKDHSRSVWQGMIYVAPGAQKTDGYQANRNLVLNPDARADSIPGLEILADDVRCTHGATVGKIDEDQVFYLNSRGIPDEEAERLIVEGFFDPIMQRIPFNGVRSRFQDAIIEKMG